MSQWTLHDDSRAYPGDTVATGTEAEMKARYFKAIRDGDITEMDAYVEDPGGAQYGWNSNRQPPGWDEL